ncbi:MAG: fibronectin type III domain-containing protein, partial [Candidatus Lokiarchaeota archaeon]|nr:fibronectin type III domain-containing protein [Candidatus Lokiarchaeota archaeon]
PTGISTPEVNPTEVYLDWDDNTEPDFMKYLIYRSTYENFIADESTYIGEVNVSEYFDRDVTQGTTYYYVVIAVDINGNPSSPSTKISVKIPSIDDSLVGLILTISVAIAIMTSLLGSLYVLVKQKKQENIPKKYPNKSTDHRVFIKSEVDVLDNSRLVHIFEDEQLIQRIDQFKDIRITLLEEDFLENIEKFDWEDEIEKKTFIKEMLVLSPNERQRIIREMLNDSYQEPPK